MSHKSASRAAQEFMNCVNDFRYQQGPNPQRRSLTNFTFFAGAGFSKSWNPSSPTGAELFSLKTEVIERFADSLALNRMFGLDTFDDISPAQLRQIIYQIDMYDKYPDLRPRYIDSQNIRRLRDIIKAAVFDRFNQLSSLNFIDPINERFLSNSLTQSQVDIVKFFKMLFDSADGSQDFVEGIRTNFVTTNYDYVIEMIIDQVIGLGDSIFDYTYRGFTPLKILGISNDISMHQHWLVWHLLKINGGFEIYRKNGDYYLDYTHKTVDDFVANPPILMLASREQDYNDDYFRNIFSKAIRLLRDTAILIIVGYSLPEDDALLRFIIKQFAEEPEDGLGKAIFYIGPGDNASKQNVISEVFPFAKTVNAPLLYTYDGTFNDFVAECLSIKI